VNQINLLNQNNKEKVDSYSLLSGIASFLGFVFLIVLLAYGGTYIYTLKLGSDIKQIKSDIITKQNSPEVKQVRDEVLTKQGQIEEVRKLVESRTDWSGVIPRLALSTLRGAVYQNVTVGRDGKVKLSVLLPDYGELDKFLSAFSASIDPNTFKNPKVISVGRANDNSGLGVTAIIEVDYDKKSGQIDPKAIIPSVKGAVIESDDSVDYQVIE